MAVSKNTEKIKKQGRLIIVAISLASVALLISAFTCYKLFRESLITICDVPVIISEDEAARSVTYSVDVVLANTCNKPFSVISYKARNEFGYESFRINSQMDFPVLLTTGEAKTMSFKITYFLKDYESVETLSETLKTFSIEFYTTKNNPYTMDVKLK